MQSILPQRKLGPFAISSIGLGCMNVSHGYATAPPPEVGADVLLRALELGVTHFDTAALYGNGESERNLGRALKALKADVVVGTKFYPTFFLKTNGLTERDVDVLDIRGDALVAT